MNVTIADGDHNNIPGILLNIRDTGTELTIFVENNEESWLKLEEIGKNIIEIAYRAAQETE